MCAAAKGYSLHIGLNYVDASHYQGWDGALAACEHDADDMEALAVSAGYTAKKLIRGEATRAAVIEHVRAAAQGLQSGDIFFLSCSSHGGSIPNAPGGDNEIDGNDETWCLYDGQLIDDELEVLWHNFAPGVRVLLISDSCHSETMARVAPPPFAAMALSAAGLPATRLMPEQVQRRVYLAQQDFYRPLQVAAKSALVRSPPIGCTVRTLSGCRDDELSYDGDQNGEFTGALLSAWNFGRFEGDYARFHDAIISRIRTSQNPQHNVIGPPDPAFDAQKPFAIAAATVRTATAREAIDDWQRAILAIERYVLDKRPTEIRRWRSVTPKSDWGMDVGTWRTVGRVIIDYFNATDPAGPQIDKTDRLVDNAVRNLHGKPLSEFHQYLVAKAGEQRSSRQLGVLEAAPAGDGQ